MHTPPAIAATGDDALQWRSLPSSHVDALRNFLAGNLTRREFDAAIGCLTPEEAHRHNNLVFGILRNALLAQSVLPSINSSTPRKKRKVETPEQRKNRIKSEIASLTKYDRDRIRVVYAEQSTSLAMGNTGGFVSVIHGFTSRRAVLAVPTIYTPVNIPLAVQADYKRIMQSSRTCLELQLLPDKSTMRDRMLIVSYELGIMGVSDDTAEYMVHGMEVYLKNVLTAIVHNKRRWRHRSQNANANDPSYTNMSTTNRELQLLPDYGKSETGSGEDISMKYEHGNEEKSNKYEKSRRRRLRKMISASSSDNDNVSTLDDLECAYYIEPSRFVELPSVMERIMASLWHEIPLSQTLSEESSLLDTA